MTNKTRTSKARALKEDGALNTKPEAVKDSKFRIGEFFDPLDLVQVKYEMLRRAHQGNISITEVVAEYGFCRPTYYQAKVDFDREGILGLVPKKRGPRRRHKLHEDVLNFLENNITPDQPIRAKNLVVLVRENFGIKVHPRTIERALLRKKNHQRVGLDIKVNGQP